MASAVTMDRESIININKEIAKHANRKELEEAMTLFNNVLSNNYANSHTYAAILNANVRCGKIQEAEKIYKCMLARGRKKDVIICTTMIKGYCLNNNLLSAIHLFNEMICKKPIIIPNIRTINTLLRGCIQIGSVSTCELLISRVQKEFKIPLDTTAWEYVIILLTQSLKLDKVLPIIGRLKSDASYQTSLFNMYINLARASALIGDWKICKKSMQSALEMKDKVNITNQLDSDINDNDDNNNHHDTKTISKGGKCGWKSNNNEEGSMNNHSISRLQSLELYQEHTKAELTAELNTIDLFMKKMTSNSNTSSNTSNAVETSKLTSFQYIFTYYIKLFPFSIDYEAQEHLLNDNKHSSSSSSTNNEKGKVLKKNIVKSIIYNVEENYGLNVFAKNLTTHSCDDLAGYMIDVPPHLSALKPVAIVNNKKKKPNKDDNSNTNGANVDHKNKQNSSLESDDIKTNNTSNNTKASKSDIETQISSYRAIVAKSFDSNVKLNFTNIFNTSTISSPLPTSNSTITDTTATATAEKPTTATNVASTNATNTATITANSAQRPLKLEVCSGAGEWIVAQASQDTTSDWIALELRNDRTYQTLTKSIFANINNLCILCGDAMQIIPNHIGGSLLTNIYVNHPEPPQQTGSNKDVTSQGYHLLNELFFMECNRILKPIDGMLTIVTDNLWYGKLLIKLLANIRYNNSTDGYILQSKTIHQLDMSKKTSNHTTTTTTTTNNNNKKANKADNKANNKADSNTSNTSVWKELDREGDIILYVGTPGLKAGHIVNASSYFDRLWKRGNLVERYFIVLHKTKVSVSNNNNNYNNYNNNMLVTNKRLNTNSLIVNIKPSKHMKTSLSNNDDIVINNNSSNKKQYFD